MLATTRLLTACLPALRPTLRRVYGWRWPLALARSVHRGRKLVTATRWGMRADEEATFVRALSFLPALALDMRERHGESASGAPAELLRALLEGAQRRVARRAELAAFTNARERWHAFVERVVLRGPISFNEVECLSLDGDRFQFRVHSCLFAEFAREVGLSDLAPLLCELNGPFLERLLPECEFHRDGPNLNTIAHGHPHCDYVWDRRAAGGPGRARPWPVAGLVADERQIPMPDRQAG